MVVSHRAPRRALRIPSRSSRRRVTPGGWPWRPPRPEPVSWEDVLPPLLAVGTLAVGALAALLVLAVVALL